MNTQGTVVDQLRKMSPEVATGIIPLTPDALAVKAGVSKQAASKTLSTLKQLGKVELVKSDNGREIIGVKPLDLAPRRPGPKAGGVINLAKSGRVRHATPVEIMPAVTRKNRNVTPTPNIDQYAKAKAHFAAMQQDWGEHIEATFKTNPWAEEGLALRDRLTTAENDLAMCRTERDGFKGQIEAVTAKKEARAGRKPHAVVATPEE